MTAHGQLMGYQESSHTGEVGDRCLDQVFGLGSRAVQFEAVAIFSC